MGRSLPKKGPTDYFLWLLTPQISHSKQIPNNAITSKCFVVLREHSEEIALFSAIRKYLVITG